MCRESEELAGCSWEPRLHGIGAREDEEVEHAPGDAPADLVIVHHRIHAVGVEEQHPMRAAICVTPSTHTVSRTIANPALVSLSIFQLRQPPACYCTLPCQATEFAVLVARNCKLLSQILALSAI